MNKENISRWVDALRSGQYEQAQDQLGVENNHGAVSYCCLGVACEVAIANGVVLDRVAENGDIRYNDHDTTLPRAVAEWLGLDSDVEVRVGWDELNSTFAIPTSEDQAVEVLVVSGLNDSHEWNFEDIATAIEFTFMREDSE